MWRGPILLALAITAAVLGAADRAGAEDLELAVKAAYLYKLAPFVDWPPDALESATSPFYLCVVGRDPFGGLLDRAVAGQAVDGRPIVVRRMSVVDRMVRCHLAYLGGSPGQSVKQELHAFQGAPVLTVTDGAASAGIVDFVLHDGRVRFRIDNDEAKASRLSISSKVLSLALSVKSAAGPRGRA